MTALIVILIILLMFTFFLNMKVKAEISFLNGKFDFSIKYLCFTIFPLKKKRKKKKKNNVKKNKSAIENQPDEEISEDLQEQPEQAGNINADNVDLEKSEEAKYPKTKKEKEPLSDKIEKICDIIEKAKIIWSVSKKWLVHIFKHIYIEELMVDFLITDENAYKTAMNYGKINAVVYNAINLVRTFFTVTIKTVDILCDFDKKESQYDFSLKITVRPATILSAVFGILFGLLINIRKLMKKNNKQHSAKKAVST